MKQYVINLALLLLISPCILEAQDHEKAIVALMQEVNVSGISLAYVKKGRVQEQYALGVTNAETRRPVNESTVFSACSLSKPVFVYAVFHLVETRQLDLDRPLYQYYAYKDVTGDPRHKLVTARMILTHSSGLPNWRDGDSLIFEHAPGAQFSYSGEGFVWLSKVVEKITAKPVEDWVREAVFKPLKMDRTSYIWQSSFGDNYAYPHTDSAQTMKKDFPSQPNVAASLQTTAADYAKFLIAVLRNKQFMAVLRSGKGVKVDSNLSWRSGLGYEETSQGPAFWQWGDNGTFKAFLIGYPEKGEGVVYFANTSLGLRIARDLLGLFIAGNQPCLDWLETDSSKAPDLQTFIRSLTMPVTEAIAPYLLHDKKAPDTSLLPESKMNYLGNRFIQLRQFEKALAFFKMNLLNYPASVGAYRGLGEVYIRMGERKAARDAWLEVSKLDPKDTSSKTIADRLNGLTAQRDTTKRTINFSLSQYMSAKYVALVGTFNGWNDLIEPMRWINGAWSASIQLPPGAYRYKFVVDGVWLPDPGNPAVKTDSFDSILEVK